MMNASAQALDIELTRQDLQALNGAEAVAAFFAHLGYDIDLRTPQTPGNLGITAESTARPIKKIELLANQENLFQVYLFELTSVTVAHTRALARAFRNRAGNYLLVLTSDYENLDFVLLEKYLPSDKGNGASIAQKQVGIRPRVLTVERRKPSRIHLRVLRRFTWTESDTFAQYDKLLSAYAVADWSEEYFNNRALFSDYYLKERLRELPEWIEDPKPTYLNLRNLYQGASAKFSGLEIAPFRQALLEPLFRLLGFSVKPGKIAGTPAPNTHYRLVGTDGGAPLALCLAYPWARSLDAKDDQRDKANPEENPSARVVSLLEQGEVPWVMVTNGKLWRLYSARTHSRATNYYEIDLEEVLAGLGPSLGDPAESFRYYWLFFRRQAFEAIEIDREGKKIQSTFLDRLLLESEDYAKELGERLKERVFEEIFPHLAAGFIAHIRAQEGEQADLSQPRLDKIFQGTLTLLYRLLFLLYAEARLLLPVRETRGYFEISLDKIKKGVAEGAGTISDQVGGLLKKHYRPDLNEIYERLNHLFKTVDQGDAALNVPFYNGGLFVSNPDPEDQSPEAQNSRFLRAHKVPDFYLSLALDQLARDLDPKRHDLVFIDYKSLGVRQLGSIYEGLLEFKLRIADRKLAIVKEKGREVYKPLSELKELQKSRVEKSGRIIKKGAVYLENDKRERKATGSYYTPDHIVKYIVENAVGPVLQERFEQLRPKLRQAQNQRREFFKRQEALLKLGIKPEPDSKADLVGRELVEEFFRVKVLDPAMGSGHFLVEAVDFITDKALDFLNAFPWNPIIARLEEMRRTILKEMDDQGITIDAGRLTDVNLLKRQVLKGCIYGVDLNPMAVELAKVSLWLDCFTLGAPLSFLDHHLRCGNSLIGVTVKEVQEALQEGQMKLFGSQFAGLLLATETMRQVGELSDITSAQVRESRREYCKAAHMLAQFKRILDVYTSQWFGNTPYKRGHGKNSVVVNPVLEFLKGDESEAWLKDPTQVADLSDFGKKVATTVLIAARGKRFFHWELEFPEIFYGPRPGTIQAIERLEGAGFDAVIGNPPYVRQEGLGDLKTYLEIAFADVYQGVADIYIYFYARGHELLGRHARFGMVTSNKFMRSNYGSRLRKFLYEKASIKDIVDFGELPVFPDAATFPCIFLFSKEISFGSPNFTQVKDLFFPSINEVVKKNAIRLGCEAFEGSNWSLGSGIEVAILRKMEEKRTTLFEYLRERETHIRRGVVTGLNEVFIIDQRIRDLLVAEDYKSAEIIKPVVVGDDVRRYRINFKNRYLIFTRRNIKINSYSAVLKYLSGYKEKLTPKKNQLEEVGRKPGNYKWYEIQDTTEYYLDFEQSKIVYPDIGMECRFTIDLNKLYVEATAFIIPLEDWALLAILNSNLGYYYFKKICPALGDADKRGRIRFKTVYLENVPIPVISESDRELLIKLAKKRFELEMKEPPQLKRGKTKKEPIKEEIIDLDREIDRIVYRLYGLTEEEIAVTKVSNYIE